MTKTRSYSSESALLDLPTEDESSFLGKRSRKQFVQEQQNTTVESYFSVSCESNDSSPRADSQVNVSVLEEPRQSESDEISPLSQNVSPAKRRPRKEKQEEQRAIFKAASDLCARFDGSHSETPSLCKGEQCVKFKCNAGHSFFKSLAHMLRLANTPSLACENEWCPKCIEFFQHCKDLTSKTNFRLLSTVFEQEIRVLCDQGHTISISAKKKTLTSIWCRECRRVEREQVKEETRRQQEQIENEYAKMQEEMFEQARRQQEKKCGGSFSNYYADDQAAASYE